MATRRAGGCIALGAGCVRPRSIPQPPSPRRPGPHPILEMPTPSEREELVRDIEGLKDRIRLAWHAILSEPMTAGERQALRASLESLISELNNLHTKLDQLPGPGVASHS
jgi:hypothetical protein